jgi:general secretion pathway protein A
MLAALLGEFGVTAPEKASRKELLDRLNQFLLAQLVLGKSCVAIFDEAQHLSSEFLEQIRVLSNLETDREKLIQIILVGQPELLTLIRTPQMAQLDQRVSVRCTLTHLSREETGRYIDHRLNVAGARGRVRFHADAVRVLHVATGGVPRLVNLAADRALLAAYSEQSRAVTEAHVRQALASLRGEEGIDADAASAKPATLKAPRPRVPWRSLAAVAAGVVLAAFLWWRLDWTAEMLAWQAGRASSTVEAERAYAMIAKEHRSSRQRENALMRLAQFQIARGASREALGWLDMLGRDYPRSKSNAERQYWTARALMASGDTARACTVGRQVSADAASTLGTDFASMNRDCTAFETRAQTVTASDSASAAGETVRPAGAPAQRDSQP